MTWTKLPELTKVKPSLHKLTLEAREDREKIADILKCNGHQCLISLAPIRIPIYDHESYKQFSLKYNFLKHNRLVNVKKRLLDVKAAAKHLSISRSKLYQWIDTGMIKSIRIDGRRLFDVFI